MDNLHIDKTKERKFSPATYVDKKCYQIYQWYMLNPKNFVVGLSGGIDSTLVVALLRETITRYRLDAKIYGISAPFIDRGVTDQDSGMKRAFVSYSYCDEFHVVDGTHTIKSLCAQLDNADQGIDFGDPWLRGQMISILRIPIFYAYSNARNGVVVGTTNMSEYIMGFWGKQSDMAVDIQIIMDLFKSEVFDVAKFLKLPEVIINAIPKGDVWDGKNDEEMMGLSYDDIERICTDSRYFDYHKSTAFDLQRSRNAHKFTGPPGPELLNIKDLVIYSFDEK